ncbi:MAG: gamma-glutamyltransferase [Gammaproteobacteria bacterium]|nr:gamma-glutamyltransferase [Gammaproteobacteria bacterium]
MPDRYAAAAVEKVLRAGGNAVDAAVTAAFVLAVTFPEAGNIGGGGFLLARMGGDLHFLDYREKAPLAASRDMYIGEDGSVNPRASLVGIRAAGVPGTVHGFWKAHRKFGTMPWAELIEPAVDLAEQGFEVASQKAAEIPEYVTWFAGAVNFMGHFGDMQQGGIFKQPALADTLRRIASQGPEDFYRGETARLLLAQMQREGGLISQQDLTEYQSVWRAPLIANWRDYKVVSAPPPSSGGFAVIQLLKMKQLLGDKFAGLEHNSSQYVHLVAEMEKRVFADRAEYFGDPDFVEVPIQSLISDQYIAARAAEVKVDTISILEDVTPGLDSPSTTHFSIVDRWGNAVSNTYTLNTSYGSGVVVEGAGFILNNEMDDFSTKPGVANSYGVVGGTANEIQPAKRMLSSMSPTLILKDDQVEMVVGAMGGSTIFTSVFQTIVNAADFGMTTKQAIGESRFHHQLLPPDEITMSIRYPLPPETRTQLEKRGYRVKPHAFEFGDMQFILRRDGNLSAASDPRGIGVANAVEY